MILKRRAQSWRRAARRAPIPREATDNARPRKHPARQFMVKIEPRMDTEKHGWSEDPSFGNPIRVSTCPFVVSQNLQHHRARFLAASSDFHIAFPRFALAFAPSVKTSRR